MKYEPDPRWGIIVYRGKVFVSHSGFTPTSVYVETEPVRIIDIGNEEALASAIDEALAAGTPSVPTPNWRMTPQSPTMKAAGVKSWSLFEKKGMGFTIFRCKDRDELTETGRDDDGRWKQDASLTQRLPKGSPGIEFAKRICERIRKRSDLP